MQMTLEISDEQATRLDKLSAQRNASREMLLSEALEVYLRNAPGISHMTPLHIGDPEERRKILLQSFGALPDLEDGLVFQERMRNEWVRDWDPEYDPKIHG